MGALVGVQNIDATMLKTLLEFDCQTITGDTGRQRPEFLSVKQHACKNIKTLVEKRLIKELIIIN